MWLCCKPLCHYKQRVDVAELPLFYCWSSSVCGSSQSWSGWLPKFDPFFLVHRYNSGKIFMKIWSVVCTWSCQQTDKQTNRKTDKCRIKHDLLDRVQDQHQRPHMDNGTLADTVLPKQWNMIQDHQKHSQWYSVQTELSSCPVQSMQTQRYGLPHSGLQTVTQCSPTPSNTVMPATRSPQYTFLSFLHQCFQYTVSHIICCLLVIRYI